MRGKIEGDEGQKSNKKKNRSCRAPEVIVRTFTFTVSEMGSDWRVWGKKKNKYDLTYF